MSTNSTSFNPGHPPETKTGICLQILLVNDEIAILEFLRTLLATWGHQVSTFVGCNEYAAKRIIEAARKVRFDAAIIDSVMPGMNGMQLIELIHHMSPTTQFIAADCGPCISAAFELSKKTILVQPLLLPFEPKELHDMLAAIVPRGRRIPKSQSTGDETRLKTQVFDAVKQVVTKFDPERLGLSGAQCNNYDADCQSIADFVWAHFPYSGAASAVGVLREIVSVIFPDSTNAKIDATIAEEMFAQFPSAFRGVDFQLVASIRSYPRECLWGHVEMAPRAVALMLYGLAKNHRPKFCSEDCFKNWECLYWQRRAIANLGLSKEEFRREQRTLRRLRRFLRSRG